MFFLDDEDWKLVDLRRGVAARAWTSGDGPKAIFVDAVTWLRERKVLLPGVTTLARLVARVRDDTTHRLWRVLEALLTPVQRRMLDRLLEVPPGLRVSDLERWRKGPPPRGSGPAIIAALDQAAEIRGLGLAGLGAEAAVPPRRSSGWRRISQASAVIPYRASVSTGTPRHWVPSLDQRVAQWMSTVTVSAGSACISCQVQDLSVPPP